MPHWNKQKILYVVMIAALLAGAVFYMLGMKDQRFYTTEEASVDGMYPFGSHQEYEQIMYVTQKTFQGFSLKFYKKEEASSDRIFVQLYQVTSKELAGVGSLREKNQGGFYYKAEELERENILPKEAAAILENNYIGTLMQQWMVEDSAVISEMPMEFLLDHPIKNAEGTSLLLVVHVEKGEGDAHHSICVSSAQQENLQGLYVDGSFVEDTNLAVCMYSEKLDMGSISVFSMMLVLLLLASAVIWKWKPENVLLFLLATVGTAYFILIPMLQVPDEKGHYYRSFEISQGDLLTPGGADGSGSSILPKELIPEKLQNLDLITYKNIRESLDIRIDAKEKVAYSNPTQALYSPASYLPQAIGCLLGRLLTDRTVVIFYMGRLLNFLTCGVLVYFAVKWIPYGKRFLLLMISMPMYLQQMVSLSSDAFINALAFLLISYVLALVNREKGITGKDMTVLSFLCAFVALCKVVYLPLCFMVLLIPTVKFTSKKAAIWCKSLICICSTILNLGWLYLGMGYMIEFRDGVDSKEQVLYILTHIPSYVVVVVRTCMDKLVDWMGTMVGAKLCLLNVYTCLILIGIYLIVMLAELLLADEQEKNTTPKLGKWCFVVLFFMIFGLTLTSLYVQWTPLRNPVIEGFQGRYFIPILPLLMLAVKKWNIPVKSEVILKFELPLIMTINVAALCSVFSCY